MKINFESEILDSISYQIHIYLYAIVVHSEYDNMLAEISEFSI